jgi:predicted transposase YbfD/YdcC
VSGAVVIAPEAKYAVTPDPSAVLVVRPIAEEERLGWQAYMRRFHYLGDCRLVGECMRYVAVLGGELVALVGWASASKSNEPRDRWLGWDRAAKAKGLHQVVNNVRYLVLPWVQQRNLASRVLGANLRRLSADWEAVYGHPVLLTETFVDKSRFAGTCYRASNWQHVGDSKGFSRRGGRYSFHGQTKAVFVYPLDRRARTLLCNPRPPAPPATERQEANDVRTASVELQIEGEVGLFAVLATVNEPRKARGIRFPLQSILGVAICAVLAGARSFMAIQEWAADQSQELLRRLRCRRGHPPSERTIRRVLMVVDAEDVDSKVGAWFSAQRTLAAGQGLALDGKTLCGSRDGEDGRAVHLLSAILHGSGEVVAQTRVDCKTNEITRVEPLLEKMDMTGAVVTADALLTQRGIARHIVEDKQADYVFTVKENQPTLLKDIADHFATEEAEARQRHAARNQPPETEAFPPSARDSQ